MKHWGRGIAAVVIASLLVRPGLAWADVVPPRKAKADQNAAAVENRLAALGVDSSTARTSAENLTPSELRYFAEDPTRIQNVGGLTFGEAMGGAVYLGLMGFLYFAFVSNQ